MMPICSRLGGPVASMSSFDETMDDLESLFAGEDDVLFGNVDLSRLDIEDIDLSVFDKDYDSGEDSDGDSKSKFKRDRNHDCMWGGQCCNKDFPKSQIQLPPRPVPVAAPQQPSGVVITHSSHNVVTIQKCRTDSVLVSSSAPARTIPKNERSLLLNRTNVQQPQQQPSPAKIVVKREFPTPQSSRPETPQSLTESDDDLSPIPIIDSKNTGILRSALDAITTVPSAYWEEDLFDVNRTKAETKPQVPLDILKLSATANSDHNYVGSSKGIKLEGLGVETPSDSEEDEEIDVVSLSERGNSSSRSSSCSGAGLPTRPTRRDQEALEEITTSLLSASEAVSRKLKQTFTTQVAGTHKRKKFEESEESSEDDDDDEEEDDDEDDDDDEEVGGYPHHHEQYEHHHRRRSIGRPSRDYTKYQRQSKRPRISNPSSQVRRKNKTARFGEEESKEKRDLHNNMERMRRIDLRISFEELKALVPAVANKDRAAKVVILREAASYCSDLGAESQSKQMQVQALRKEQMRLRSVVSSLRKAAAMACVNKTSKHH